jgi:hypothetical protein
MTTCSWSLAKGFYASLKIVSKVFRERDDRSKLESVRRAIS